MAQPKRKTGRTFEERFLAELERQSDAQHNPVKNSALREQLGWQDARFTKVRNGLIKSKIIRASVGHGGKTAFVSPPHSVIEQKSLRAFISYSHTDESLKDEFVKHLHPLKRLGLLENWHDRKIRPGDEFDKSISNELDKADLVFLLISVDFINSKYCYDIELERSMEKHNNKTSRVVPIILRDCLWEHSSFGGLQALPKDGKAVRGFPDTDTAFKEIAKAVHDLALELLQTKSLPHSINEP